MIAMTWLEVDNDSEKINHRKLADNYNLLSIIEM